MKPRCVWDLAAELGEGPVWVERERALYFVDILGRAIHCWRQDGSHRSWIAPAEPGFIVPRRRGGFICGLRGGLYDFDPEASTFKLLVPVEPNKPRHRINDGFVDRSGRVWFGTMHDDTQTVGGALYRVDDEKALLHTHDTEYVVTNGPVTSPDGRTLYHTDSALRTVYAFDLSEKGALSSKRAFTRFPEGVYPDGMAVDEDGNVWIALFNGWRLEQYSPQAVKLNEISFPCAHITKPVFGGDELRTLYVTTAWTTLTPESRMTQPEAGGLFAVDVAVAGLYGACANL